METLGRREQNKIEKRQRLMAAARQLFQTDGLAATTSAIAQAAGVGEGTLYLYFASKEDLLVEVFQDDIRRIWNDAFALVRPEDPIVEQIIGVFGGVTSVHERDADLARIWFGELPFASRSTQSAANDVVAWAQHRLEALLDGAAPARGARFRRRRRHSCSHVPRPLDCLDDPAALGGDHRRPGDRTTRRGAAHDVSLHGASDVASSYGSGASKQHCDGERVHARRGTFSSTRHHGSSTTSLRDHC